MLRAVAIAVAVGAVSGTSCIIPDHGIVALVDCGVRWCATAEFAKALDGDDNTVQVQEPRPDGSSDWVTECVCMLPSEDLVLRSEAPPMQYEILRDRERRRHGGEDRGGGDGRRGVGDGGREGGGGDRARGGADRAGGGEGVTRDVGGDDGTCPATWLDSA